MAESGRAVHIIEFPILLFMLDIYSCCDSVFDENV